MSLYLSPGAFPECLSSNILAPGGQGYISLNASTGENHACYRIRGSEKPLSFGFELFFKGVTDRRSYRHKPLGDKRNSLERGATMMDLIKETQLRCC